MVDSLVCGLWCAVVFCGHPPKRLLPITALLVSQKSGFAHAQTLTSTAQPITVSASRSAVCLCVLCMGVDSIGDRSLSCAIENVLSALRKNSTSLSFLDY